ncbi:MAG: hypothetical protein NC218_03430 [Acetobacter sp.]|nr:hypothetical protein [Acetobacter sp.]
MNNEDISDQLAEDVSNGKIVKVDELTQLCQKHNIDAYEDVLGPMGYNSCDRCGLLMDSEQFFWLDGFEWDEENEGDRWLQAGLQKEDEDYCALCDNCLKELIEKGKK